MQCSTAPIQPLKVCRMNTVKTLPTLALTPEDRADLTRAATLIETLRAVSPSLTLAQAATLISAALNQGSSITEIARASGLNLTAVSVNVGILGGGVRQNAKRIEGLELLQADYAPDSNRTKVVTLTPRGASTIRALLGAIRRT